MDLQRWRVINATKYDLIDQHAICRTWDIVSFLNVYTMKGSKMDKDLSIYNEAYHDINLFQIDYHCSLVNLFS